MYKKVYIEITNTCNLSCDFCIKNKRNNKFMSINEFEIILKKLEKTKKKYPVDKAKGISTKYNKL